MSGASVRSEQKRSVGTLPPLHKTVLMCLKHSLSKCFLERKIILISVIARLVPAMGQSLTLATGVEAWTKMETSGEEREGNGN